MYLKSFHFEHILISFSFISNHFIFNMFSFHFLLFQINLFSTHFQWNLFYYKRFSSNTFSIQSLFSHFSDACDDVSVPSAIDGELDAFSASSTCIASSSSNIFACESLSVSVSIPVSSSTSASTSTSFCCIEVNVWM